MTQSSVFIFSLAIRGSPYAYNHTIKEHKKKAKYCSLLFFAAKHHIKKNG